MIDKIGYRTHTIDELVNIFSKHFIVLSPSLNQYKIDSLVEEHWAKDYVVQIHRKKLISYKAYIETDIEKKRCLLITEKMTWIFAIQINDDTEDLLLLR